MFCNIHQDVFDVSARLTKQAQRRRIYTEYIFLQTSTNKYGFTQNWFVDTQQTNLIAPLN